MERTRSAVPAKNMKWVSLMTLLLISACSRADPNAANSGPVATPPHAIVETSQPAITPDSPDAPAPADASSEVVPQLDASFTDSKTRPEYQACVDQSGGETVALQACGDAELSWQDARLNRLYKLAMSKQSKGARDALRDVQREWLKQTDQACAWDANHQGQAQAIDAQSCRLNRTTNRADELQKLLGS